MNLSGRDLTIGYPDRVVGRGLDVALKQGEVLDGEGGFCVWGKQVPAERSLAEGLLPLGLAHGIKLKRDLAEGECLKWSDVVYDEHDLAVKVRREMEAAFGRPNTGSGDATG